MKELQVIERLAKEGKEVSRYEVSNYNGYVLVYLCQDEYKFWYDSQSSKFKELNSFEEEMVYLCSASSKFFNGAMLGSSLPGKSVAAIKQNAEDLGFRLEDIRDLTHVKYLVLESEKK